MVQASQVRFTYRSVFLPEQETPPVQLLPLIQKMDKQVCVVGPAV